MRRVAIACLLCACGRLGFDTAGPGGGTGGDGSVGGDGAMIDAPGSGSGGPRQVSPVTGGAGPIMPILPMPTMNGDLLIATIASNDLTNLVLPDGSWQLNASFSTSGACASAMATRTNAPAGMTSFTFGFPAGNPAVVQLSEWAGIGGGDGAGIGGGNNPTTMFSITTMSADTAAGDIGIATFCEDVNSPSFAAGPGWTKLGELANVASSPSMTAVFQSNLPAQKITATATTTVGGKFAATLLTFTVH
jgi:hypothetical protein